AAHALDRLDPDLLFLEAELPQNRLQISRDARRRRMADDAFAAELVDALELHRSDEPVVPAILRLREIHEPLMSLGALAIRLVVQSRDEIDLAGINELGSMLHRRRARAADDFKVDLEAVLPRHPRFLENREQRQMRRIAGEQRE